MTILPVGLSLVFAELILLPFDFLKSYARMRVASLLFYLVGFGALYFLNFIGLYQIAFLVLFVELFVTIYSYFSCVNNGMQIVIRNRTKGD